MSVIVPPFTVLDKNNAQKQITYSELRSALRFYDVEADDRWSEALVVEPGASLEINGSEASPMLRRVLETPSLDQYKAWIGTPDAYIEKGLAQPPKTLPGISPSRLEQPKNNLGTADLEDLQRAFDYFVFGNSRVVADYRTAITMHYAPFAAALYACSRVEIRSGASLDFTGLPTILLIDRLIIHQGGCIKFYTPAKAVVSVLEKVGA